MPQNTGAEITICFHIMTVCLETRTSGSKQVWQLLKNACEADNEDAFALIQAAQLQLP